MPRFSSVKSAINTKFLFVLFFTEKYEFLLLLFVTEKYDKTFSSNFFFAKRNSKSHIVLRSR
ncbi:MAG TPA: hypothetical protein DD628_05085 [Clostridiales bacterium]|nr:hypothetical protein [Candidatus Apopatosoma intestinale]